MDKKSSIALNSEEDCECMRVSGHLEAVDWLLWFRHYKPSPGNLALGDWVADPHLWLYYVESCDGLLPIDDVLMTTNTRYWSIHDVQRYFVGDMHCEKILFTYQYPNLRMPTPLGSYFWRANTALKLPPRVYMKELFTSLEFTLKKMQNTEAQMDRLIVNDQLINIDRLDYFKRKMLFKVLLNLLQIQENLQLVSFENLCCERLEGVRLIQQLACFNAKTLKYLFLWRFFQTNQNPLLINFSYITGTGQYIPRPPTKHCFIHCLAKLRNLRLLALEYSNIADGTGGALLTLIPILKRPHFRLQLICREDQTPCKVDAALGVGGYGIPDQAWKCVAIACPDIYLQMAFYRVRDYDNIVRFLTPSIPLRETHLQLGIDLKMRQRQDSDVSCFVRHIAYCYAGTLVTLSIHQWRFALFPLRRVLELMPRLVRFHYVGRVQDDVDIKRMLMIISCGVCERLKHIKIQIQDETSRRDYWRRAVESLNKEFADIIKLYDINLCISIYRN